MTTKTTKRGLKSWPPPSGRALPVSLAAAHTTRPPRPPSGLGVFLDGSSRRGSRWAIAINLNNSGWQDEHAMVSAVVSPLACRSCGGLAGGGKASGPYEEWRADCTFFTRSVFSSLADNHDNYNDTYTYHCHYRHGSAKKCNQRGYCNAMYSPSVL